jgi:hypothetical protein
MTGGFDSPWHFFQGASSVDQSWGFWWLIFPIGFFIFGAWDCWLNYQRSRHALEVMKQYAAMGKDPPPELVRQLQGSAYGYYGYRGLWRHRYRRYPPPEASADPAHLADPLDGRDWRGGRYPDWRSALVTAAIAGAFWIAAEFSYIPDADGAFRFVAIIMSCVAAALLVSALLPPSFRDR